MLLRLSQAFLLTKREVVRFIWKDDGAYFNVVMTREGAIDHETALTTGTFESAPLPGGITSRELAVSTLVALGMTNRQIATRLGTCPRTVSTQLERLLIKFGIESRSALAVLRVDVGLFCLPVPGGVDDVPPLTQASMQRFAERRTRHCLSIRSSLSRSPIEAAGILGRRRTMDGRA